MICDRPTYREALAQAEHRVALGQDVVYLYDETDFPWEKAERVETSGGYRFNGPIGCYVIVTEAGLTFKLNVDFECRKANGQSASLFDRERLRSLAMKMPPQARRSFAEMLAERVLPDLMKRTSEYRDILQRQWDSEDCVRGLIAFARCYAP